MQMVARVCLIIEDEICISLSPFNPKGAPFAQKCKVQSDLREELAASKERVQLLHEVVNDWTQF